MKWLDRLSKVLALAFDTRAEPERRAALKLAADIAAKRNLTLGRAYLCIERSMPDTFRYLEAKREAAGVTRLFEDANCEITNETWNADLDSYPGNKLALDAMLSCVVRPVRRYR